MFYLHTNVSTCVQGSPHFGQVNVFFLPPPPSLPVVPPAFDPASLFGGVGSDGTLFKITEVHMGREATILTILCTEKETDVNLRKAIQRKQVSILRFFSSDNFLNK